MNHKTQKKQISVNRNILILTAVLVFLASLNCLFIYLSRNKLSEIASLRQEREILEKDRQIVQAADELTQKYQNQIEVFSKVFPSEQTISVFIGDLEKVLKNVSPDYRFQFSSLNPLPEQDKLYLLLTLTLKTDLSEFLNLLEDLEQIPYMMHINSISVNAPLGVTSPVDIRINLKLYVQQPFTVQ